MKELVILSGKGGTEKTSIVGSRAQGLFRQNRIQAIIGALESDPDKAILSYLNGTLAMGDNICDH